MTTISADAITLNVGGTLFTVSKSCLANGPPGVLANLVKPEWSEGLCRDECGRPFICRDAVMFPAILTFLRTGVAWANASIPLAAVRGEFDYFFAEPPPVFPAAYLDILAHPVFQHMQAIRDAVPAMCATTWAWVADKTTEGLVFPGETQDVAYDPILVAANNLPNLDPTMSVVVLVHTRTRISIRFKYNPLPRNVQCNILDEQSPARDRRVYAPSILSLSRLAGYQDIAECVRILFAADSATVDWYLPGAEFDLVWYAAAAAGNSNK